LRAVDTIEEKLKELGAELVAEGVKVEFDPSEEELKNCKQPDWLVTSADCHNDEVGPSER